jgi:glycosyltransferase involved in cell wall biosynthesis
MTDKGYDIEFVPATGEIGTDLKLYDKFPKNAKIRHVLSDDKDEADIVFFQVNDTLYRYHMAKIGDYVAPWFKAAKRRIIDINYTTWGLEKYRHADGYICQSYQLVNNLVDIFSKYNQMIMDNNGKRLIHIELLKPPADLSRFLNRDYDRARFVEKHYTKSGVIRLLRHSSQGDQKYPNNINEMIDTILKLEGHIDIVLMPAPSFIKFGHGSGNIKPIHPNVDVFDFDKLPIEEFLDYGNVFWYWVPKDKFIEAGCNAVLEAMAAGLPILCNDNGGLVDIIDDEVGWMCKTEQEMYDAIKNMTMDEIKKKGQAAREKVKKLVDPDAWTEIIIGE